MNLQCISHCNTGRFSVSYDTKPPLTILVTFKMKYLTCPCANHLHYHSMLNFILFLINCYSNILYSIYDIIYLSK